MDVHLLVRWAHVVAASVLVGGPLIVAVLLHARRGEPPEAAVRDLARRAERWLWGAAGVVVATGIGNLGAFGGNLPGPTTDWGRTLTFKLVVVAVLLVVAGVRTFAVARVGHTAQAARLVPWYVASSALGVAAMGLAEVLAHG